MTTDSSDNLFVRNGQLYIMPTLTSDTLGTDAILDGGNYTLDGCTTDNAVSTLPFIPAVALAFSIH